MSHFYDMMWPFIMINTVELQLKIQLCKQIHQFFWIIYLYHHRTYLKQHTMCLWLQIWGAVSSHRASLRHTDNNMKLGKVSFLLCSCCHVSERWIQWRDWQRLDPLICIHLQRALLHTYSIWTRIACFRPTALHLLYLSYWNNVGS